MKLLLKQVSISDKSSPYHGSVKDILIINGKIDNIADAIDADGAEVIEHKDMIASPGWVDIFSHFNDPGYEYKETIESGAEAAAAGGYTNVFVLPNTKPVADSKSSIEYVLQKSKELPVNVLPIGAISKQTEGIELSEMYDMHNSGAVAFSDGIKPIQSPGLLLKALQYVKAIDAVLIQVPVDKSISKSGLVNEGVTSTRLGLPGIPAIAEELMISRDIELVKYTESRLHITGVSTAKGLQLIKKAKKEGINITCSITPYHLTFCDEDLSTYDTNLKVDPPLRSRSDMEELRQSILDGTVDCIASHHFPQDIDNKKCEFEYASPGMIGLQTVLNVINDLFPELTTERLIDLLSSNQREIFSLHKSVIREGAKADITIFDRHSLSVCRNDSNKSKSSNTPYFNKEFKGRVIGIINKDKVYLNK